MNYKKIALAFAALIAVIIIFQFKHLISLENAKQYQEQLTQFISHNFITAFSLYFVTYVLATALSVPGAAILTLLSAALFGFWPSVLLVSFASSIGALFAFLFSRYLLKDWVQARFKDHLSSINAGISKDGALYLLSLRLIPVFPFFVINLLMGLTPIKARTYYLFSQLGMFPATLVYLNAGTQLSEINSLSGLVSPNVLMAFALLGLFPLLLKMIINTVKRNVVYKAWKKPKHFDQNMIVIGAGAGGLVSSYIAAAVKAKVILVEKHKMGGDCLNTGCVPSKALIRVCKNIKEINDAQKFGIDAQINNIDFKKIQTRIKDVISKIEPHDSIERYQTLGVQCLQGDAKILNPWQVQINDQVICTKNIVIATGAKPFIPAIPGIESIQFSSSDTIWDIEQLPTRLLVIGGGPIGAELSQCFNRLGCHVTIVEFADQVLAKEDKDAANLVEQQLTEEGVTLLLKHKLVKFEKTPTEQVAHLKVDQQALTVTFDLVLFAVGRKANVTGFGLEKLDMPLTKTGTIEVNEYLQTKYPNIYAVGDVTGPIQLTHFAAHQAWYAAVNGLFGALKKFKVDYSVIPAVTYTFPEVARVGINEKEALAAKLDIEITKFEINDLDRAIADGNDLGFIKIITPKGSDRILGATIVGSHAGELLAEFTLAMRYKLGLNKILATVHPYPTMSEAAKYTAGVWKRNHAPQKILTWVEKYHQFTRKY
jgi:dihydrolipoamide dehydrogenase